MKKVVLLLTAIVALAMSLPAQDTTTTSSSKKDQSAQTEKAEKESAGTAKKASQLTGCLSEPSGGSGFVLTNSRYPSGVAVTPASSVDLKPHVGHEVKLKGSWEKGTDPKTKSFTATDMKHIADKCPAAGAKTDKKEMKEEKKEEKKEKKSEDKY